MCRLLAVLLLALVIAPASAAQARNTRPLVLVVHGRGHTVGDTASLRRDALRALQSGARDLGADALLADDDVRLVFYADVLVSASASRSGGTSTACESALVGRSEAGSVFSLFAMLAGALVDAGANDESTSDREGLRSLAGDLRYLGDQRMRCAAELRLGAALARARDERRPVVLVAHSLGALVAWGHLHARHARDGQSLPEVQRLITLGSPLGSSDIRQLIFGEDTTGVSLPAAVKSWFNIVNPDDPFAMRLTSPDSHPVQGIVDVSTERGAIDPHDLRTYLDDRTTVRTVLNAWCDAFTADRPAAIATACARLSH